jgi:hypothetical protein
MFCGGSCRVDSHSETVLGRPSLRLHRNHSEAGLVVSSRSSVGDEINSRTGSIATLDYDQFYSGWRQHALEFDRYTSYGLPFHRH